MSWFDVYGPFDLPKEGLRSNGVRSKFWRKAEEDYGIKKKKLQKAIGCYLYAIRHGESLRPWYVGMTAAQTGFAGEVFTGHKLKLFEKYIAPRNGQPVLILFPLVIDEDGNKFSAAHVSAKPTIQWVERTLMGMAYARNDDLINKRDLTLPRNVMVLGVIGRPTRGRRHAEVLEARKALLGDR